MNNFKRCQSCNQESVLEVIMVPHGGSYKGLQTIDESNKEIICNDFREIGIGLGNTIRLVYCLKCGQVQGNWPKDSILQTITDK